MRVIEQNIKARGLFFVYNNITIFLLKSYETWLWVITYDVIQAWTKITYHFAQLWWSIGDTKIWRFIDVKEILKLPFLSKICYVSDWCYWGNSAFFVHRIALFLPSNQSNDSSLSLNLNLFQTISYKEQFEW